MRAIIDLLANSRRCCRLVSDVTVGSKAITLHWNWRMAFALDGHRSDFVLARPLLVRDEGS